LTLARELTVHGREGGPQDSAAIRDFAQDVDENQCRAQNLERELTVPGREGGPQDSAAIRDFAQGVDENQCRAQNLERELTVPGWEGGPQNSAAIRDFAQDVDERGHRAQSSNGELTVQPRPQDYEIAQTSASLHTILVTSSSTPKRPCDAASLKLYWK
jgi:hypothetical protein